MKNGWIRLVFAGCLVAVCLVPVVMAQQRGDARSGASMLTGAVTSQPIGHYEFCRRNRRECLGNLARSAPPRVTAFGWKTVREINMSVNRTVLPMTDEEVHGREEVWSYPGTAGDCEDYALLKRAMLIERGFSAADLLITVVRKPNGEGHAVLTLRTAEGDYVLDNLVDTIKAWTDTPYTYLKRQASFHPGRWVEIRNGGELLVGSIPD